MTMNNEFNKLRNEGTFYFSNKTYMDRYTDNKPYKYRCDFEEPIYFIPDKQKITLLQLYCKYFPKTRSNELAFIRVSWCRSPKYKFLTKNKHVNNILGSVLLVKRRYKSLYYPKFLQKENMNHLFSNTILIEIVDSKGDHITDLSDETIVSVYVYKEK